MNPYMSNVRQTILYKNQTKSTQHHSTPQAGGGTKSGPQQQPEGEGEEGLTELGRLYQARIREFLKTSTQVGQHALLCFTFCVICFSPFSSCSLYPLVQS
jgi:hypothetical protein